MKNKNIKYLAILILCLCLTGCFNKKSIVADNPLAKIKKEMLKDVRNYSYDVSVKVNDTNKQRKYDILMECNNDLVNKTGYCLTHNSEYNYEKYVNYKNRNTYSRIIYLANNNTLPWEKNNKYSNTNINHFLNIVDNIKNIEKVDEDDGTYYTGKISDKRLAGIVAEADQDINTDYLYGKLIPINIYIDVNGNILKISSEFTYDNITDIVEIVFKNFNETENVIIPKM